MMDLARFMEVISHFGFRLAANPYDRSIRVVRTTIEPVERGRAGCCKRTLDDVGIGAGMLGGGRALPVHSIDGDPAKAISNEAGPALARARSTKAEARCNA